ncbi:MAG: DEAD/DEAH box helicase, partial [Candidatus Micrarchaeaceae archaeon]
MEIGELSGMVPSEVIESIIERGIKVLNPPQEDSVKKGVLKGKSAVISSPTASGKTLIAEICMATAIIWHRKKALYVGPMRALVSEKYEEFSKSYPFIKSAISLGDLDSLDPWLEKYEAIFASTEKVDSLIRHGVSWLEDVKCIVIDEFHMIDEFSRGPVLEILITKLKRLCKDAQFIFLSATVGNSRELAEWVGAELIESEYRPVPLYKGVVYGSSVYYLERKETLLGSSKQPEIRVVEDTLANGKQAIIFYSTKKNAEAGAERIAKVVESMCKLEKEKLGALSQEILGALPRPTLQCEKLANLVLSGVSFHHSGLINSQRKAIESAFRDGFLKVICSTTTLGLGVNMPANTVLVKNLSRYDESSGSEKLRANEVIQLFGRAGRPKYDSFGRALIIANNKSEIDLLTEKYILSKPEPVSSKLGYLPVLRMHTLALLAGGVSRSKEGVVDFIKSTFFGKNARESDIEEMCSEVIEELEEWGFVYKKGREIRATRIGERVSDLYIDPLSARIMITSLPKANDELDYLFIICNSLEMKPYVKPVEEAYENMYKFYNLIDEREIEREEFFFYEPEKALSTALMLRDWIEEKSEREIVEKYGTTPGSLFLKISNADWILYAASELSKLIGRNPAKVIELRARVMYGIKRELIELVQLEHVGRVRARMMFNAGIKSVRDLKQAGALEKLQLLFGKEI